MHAANTNDASAFAGLYTDDAVVIDETAPFIWRGPGAGTAWWRAVVGVERKLKMRNLRAVDIRVTEFRGSATDAYLVQAMTVTAIANGKPFSEPGTTTYTFHNSGGTWLISSQVWTAKPKE